MFAVVRRRFTESSLSESHSTVGAARARPESAPARPQRAKQTPPATGPCQLWALFLRLTDCHCVAANALQSPSITARAFIGGAFTPAAIGAEYFTALGEMPPPTNRGSEPSAV